MNLTIAAFTYGIWALPLAAFLLLSLMPRRFSKQAPTLSILCSLALTALGTAGILMLWGGDTDTPKVVLDFAWLRLDREAVGTVRFGFLWDRLSLSVLFAVLWVQSAVQVFSLYYLGQDPDKKRYFAYLHLFVLAMIGLISASNLLQLFAFWEAVGLASYLLIGFWFEKPEAARAAKKAFVLNRLADAGFLLGLILLAQAIGSLDFSVLADGGGSWRLSHPLIALAGLLLFVGVAGKSAQIPFSSWLPDAMEGPTPVSALIHSATMVAAGVFLLIRLSPIFASSPALMTLITAAGFATSLFAALCAIPQTDIKRLLAYSTISQLGLMVMAAGAGGFDAALYHLLTHAFFKSLLFLCAGVWIHRHHSQLIASIARGGWQKDLLPFGFALWGFLSLAGFPGTGGFFSKESILETLFERHWGWGIGGLIIAALTAVYSTRFIASFFNPTKAPHNEPHHEPHHAETLQTKIPQAVPLAVLSVLSLAAAKWGSSILPKVEAAHSHAVGPSPLVLFLSALGALLLGGAIGLSRAREAQTTPGALRSFLLKGAGLDALIGWGTRSVFHPLTRLLQKFDQKIPNELMVDRFCGALSAAGEGFRRIQTGRLRFYLGFAFSWLGLILIWLLMEGS